MEFSSDSQIFAKMASWWLLLLFLGISCLKPASPVCHDPLEDSMRVEHEWKYIDYDYGSDVCRQAAIKSGEYNRSNCLPFDVDRWNDKTFVTIIRDEGVPSSLNVISNKRGPGGPLLTPYPDWSWAKNINCNGITSVYSVAIDRCDRLWVLDTGMSGLKYICPSKLLTFDLYTSKLLNAVVIPDSIARNVTTGKGYLITPLVKTSAFSCSVSTVYMTDTLGFGLVVYNGREFRRLTSSAMDYDPKAETFTIDGESFQMQGGILGMALSHSKPRLYFSTFASYNLGYFDTKECDHFLCGNNPEFHVYQDILWTQSAAKAMSKTGTLFFGLMNDTSIGCWNENKELALWNIDVIARNRATLQVISGMKVKEDHNGKEALWAIANRYQKVIAGALNFDEVNFRILMANVEDLISNSRCA